MLSVESLRFFETLLGQVRLEAGHPDFERLAAETVTAKRELAEEIESVTNANAKETHP